VRRHMTFMDRDGVHIDDQCIEVPGRRLPLTDIREVFIVNEPPDFTAITVTTIGTALCAMVVVRLVVAAPVHIAIAVAGFSALFSAVAMRYWGRRRLSLWACCSGRGEKLLEAGGDTFVNQVGRALVRACEWNGAGPPAVYRLSARHSRRQGCA